MSYIGNEPIVSATRTITEITATAGQTVFVANGGYTVGYIDVFVNGAQLQTSDFTALDGSSITLAQAAQVGDDVRLVAWGTFQTSEALTSNNPSYTGTLTGGTGVVNIGSGQLYKDASGNVGIGTSSPTARLQVNGTSVLSDSVYGGGNIELGIKGNGDRYAFIDLHSSDTLDYSARIIRYPGVNGNFEITNAGTGVVTFVSNNTERMRIDSSGNLRYGSSNNGVGARARFEPAFGQTTMEVVAGGDNGNLIRFNNYQNVGGTISIVTNGTTTYGTSSDYRLKENITPMTGALEKVSALKPVTYTWKIDGSDGQGFIAHELAEVVPDAVTGEKDAVDAEGKPVYQGIDTSFLVATLTAAIQELKATVDAQAKRIETLEQGGV